MKQKLRYFYSPRNAGIIVANLKTGRCHRAETGGKKTPTSLDVQFLNRSHLAALVGNDVAPYRISRDNAQRFINWGGIPTMMKGCRA